MGTQVMKGKVCVISQPTFMPWMGWFDLADQADIMVILDDVPFSKQSWQQRNRIRTRNGLEYLSVPVKTSGRLGQKILDCDLADQPFLNKMLKTIQANYSKAPFFAGAMDELEATMRTAVETGKLVEFNCAIIDWMVKRLGMSTPMVRASTLGIGGQRGEHVAAICEGVGADRYLSPAGAEDYLLEDREAFDQRGISVWMHEYAHPQYAQCFSPFEPYASTLDVILNHGPGAMEIIRSGRHPMRPLGSDRAIPSEVLS